MLDLAGVKPGAKRARATSLVPLARDEVGGSPRAALTVDGQVARGLKVQRYRLVHRGPGRIELYDELDDPREQKDVAAERPIALRVDARRARPAVRLRDDLVEGALGHRRQRHRGVLRRSRTARPPRRRAGLGRTEVAEIAGCPRAAQTHVRRVIPENTETIVDDDEAAYAPESGQPRGGRENPWDDDDEKSAGAHAFPAEHHESPKDEF